MHDPNMVNELVQSYFVSLFHVEEEHVIPTSLHGFFPIISEGTRCSLLAPFKVEEVKASVFAMSPYKAPGPDGFHAGFFQRC